MTRMPVNKYDDSRMLEAEPTAREFFRAILDVDYDKDILFLSDKGKLSHFRDCGDCPEDRHWDNWVTERIYNYYGISVTSIHIHLIDLFEAIRNRKASPVQ